MHEQNKSSIISKFHCYVQKGTKAYMRLYLFRLPTLLNQDIKKIQYAEYVQGTAS
jgi:hypothetical protein